MNATLYFFWLIQCISTQVFCVDMIMRSIEAHFVWTCVTEVEYPDANWGYISPFSLNDNEQLNINNDHKFRKWDVI